MRRTTSRPSQVGGTPVIIRNRITNFGIKFNLITRRLFPPAYSNNHQVILKVLKQTDQVKLTIRHAATAGILLLKFPSSYPKLVTKGFSAASNYINGEVKKAYAKKPIALKRTHGFDMYLDVRNGLVSPFVAVANSYEMSTTDLFLTLVKKGNTVVDVGANLGWFTLLGARRVGETGKVLSFEPEPSNFQLLLKSVTRNGFDNVQLFEKVVSDVDSTQLLHLSNAERSAHLPSLVRNFGGAEIKVSSTRLDTAALDAHLDHIDLLKVDVEGAEPLVLRGAEELLSKRLIKYIILEWSPEVWVGQEELTSRLLESHSGFEIRTRSSHVLKRIEHHELPRHGANLFFEPR
jgi:FkbM family methyltransferase